MNDYDKYITGFYYSNSPMNQQEPKDQEQETYTEILENELNATYFKDFFTGFKDTVQLIHQNNKRINEIEQDLSLFGCISSDERLELQQCKKDLTKLIELL